MITSPDINELATDLAAAQAQIRGAVKNSTNPQFRSQYSDLASVVESSREALSSHGIAVVQGIGRYHDGCIAVTTRLMHRSGQWIEETMDVPVVAKVINAQALMSASTYGRRYGLMGMVGIAPIEDDDGNAACTGDENTAAATPTQLNKINELIDSTGAKREGILQHFQVQSFEELSQGGANRLVAMLQKKAVGNGS